jgi:hypothetical protein
LVRSRWLRIAALLLLAAIPLLLAKRTRGLSSPGEETASLEASSSHAKYAGVDERASHGSSDEGETSPASKPSKTRERSPRSGQEPIAGQQGSSGSNISLAAQGQRRIDARAITRRQRTSRNDGSLEEESHELSHAPGDVASSPAAHSADGGHRSVSNHTAADSSAAIPVSADKPSVSKPAVTRPPEMPISHLIDDDVVAEVAPDVPADTMEAIRQTFEQEAGVNELAQDDPVYAERWSQAELDTAERIRSLYGWGAFAEFQRKLVMEKLAASNAQGGQ